MRGSREGSGSGDGGGGWESHPPPLEKFKLN